MSVRRRTRHALKLVLVPAALAGVYRLVVEGALTLDLGVGRRTRPLGPLAVDIAAPRELVFEVVAAPYLGRAPRSLAAHVEVVERGGDMVLAAHRTPVGGGLVATTLETVRFERPHTVGFRLLRGPVPHVVERFELEEIGDSTRLRYEGELGTDLWRVGQWWGALVARSWVAAVEGSLADVRERAERRAAAQRRRTGGEADAPTAGIDGPKSG